MKSISFVLKRFKTIRGCDDFSLHPKRLFFYRNNFSFLRKTPKNKFFIYGQGRSGSSLLVDLLNSHPKVFCDGEIFGMPKMGKVLFPYFYIEHASKKKNLEKYSHYGFKVKTYQLTVDQKIHNERFLIEKLIDKGWKMIYLKRKNILKHAFSSIMAEELKVWRMTKSVEIPKVKVDIPKLIRIINWREMHFKHELEVISNLPYIPVIYEKDLMNNDNHQQICNKIFEYIGLPYVKVVTSLKKMTKSSVLAP